MWLHSELQLRTFYFSTKKNWQVFISHKTFFLSIHLKCLTEEILMMSTGTHTFINEKIVNFFSG